MDEREENELARRLVRMDESAWVMFCQEYTTPLSRIVRLHLGCAPEVCDEIVQRSLVRCVRLIGSFDASRGRLLSWLTRLTINEARGFLGRETARQIAIPSIEVLSQIADVIDGGPLPDEVLESRETQLLVEECLWDLNSRQREMLEMKYMDEMTVAQIGQELALSPQAVKSLLSRGRDALRKALLDRLARQGMQVVEILR